MENIVLGVITYLLNQIQDRRMNVSTSINYILILDLSAPIEVSAKIRGNNGVEIQYIAVIIVD